MYFRQSNNDDSILGRSAVVYPHTSEATRAQEKTTGTTIRTNTDTVSTHSWPTAVGLRKGLGLGGCIESISSSGGTDHINTCHRRPQRYLVRKKEAGKTPATEEGVTCRSDGLFHFHVYMHASRGKTSSQSGRPMYAFEILVSSWKSLPFHIYPLFLLMSGSLSLWRAQICIH